MVMEIGSYFFLCEGKEMSKMIISVLLAVFLLSCAAGQSLQKEPENIPVGSKSSERDDALSERLKALEQSVSSLRSEVANLGYRLNNMQARSSLTSFKLSIFKFSGLSAITMSASYPALIFPLL